MNGLCTEPNLREIIVIGTDESVHQYSTLRGLFSTRLTFDGMVPQGLREDFM